jgi:tRNA 2-thiouridine synthesizing protein D
MEISIAVYGSPYGSQASETAYRYAQAALSLGHHIYRVFFYGEGVTNATKLTVAPQDEIDLPFRWRQFGAEHEIDLVVCIAAALKRGIIDQAEAERYEKKAHNQAAEFTLSGLGQLLDAALHSDRLITFGS